MFDFVRDTAQLLPSDLSKLLGVHRCTVSFWYNGNAEPHRDLTRRLNKLLDLVKAATDAGDLPVPHHINRRERAHYLRQVILKQVRRPDEQPAASAPSEG